MNQRFNPEHSEFEAYGLSVSRWQPTLMNRADRHNEIELNFVLLQPVGFQIGGRRIMVQTGQLMMFWAAIPHQLVAPICEDSYYVATIPLSMYLHFDLPEVMVQATLHGCVQTADIASVLREAG